MFWLLMSGCETFLITLCMSEIIPVEPALDNASEGNPVIQIPHNLQNVQNEQVFILFILLKLKTNKVIAVNWLKQQC